MRQVERMRRILKIRTTLIQMKDFIDEEQANCDAVAMRYIQSLQDELVCVSTLMAPSERNKAIIPEVTRCGAQRKQSSGQCRRFRRRCRALYHPRRFVSRSSSCSYSSNQRSERNTQKNSFAPNFNDSTAFRSTAALSPEFKSQCSFAYVVACHGLPLGWLESLAPVFFKFNFR